MLDKQECIRSTLCKFSSTIYIYVSKKLKFVIKFSLNNLIFSIYNLQRFKISNSI